MTQVTNFNAAICQNFSRFSNYESFISKLFYFIILHILHNAP